MRILHLDAGRQMRGGQWQVLRLIEGLAAQGVEPALLARSGAPLFEAARARGWRVEPLGFPRLLLRVRREDIVHAHDGKIIVRSAPGEGSRFTIELPAKKEQS